VILNVTTPRFWRGLKMQEHEKLYNLKQSIISSTFSVTLNVQSDHPWPERLKSLTAFLIGSCGISSHIDCKPCLALAAVCDTSLASPPTHGSQVGSDVANLVATGPSQSSQGSWHAATPA